MEGDVITFEMPCPDPFRSDIHTLSFEIMSGGRIEVFATAHEHRMTWMLSQEQRHELIAFLQQPTSTNVP